MLGFLPLFFSCIFCKIDCRSIYCIFCITIYHTLRKEYYILVTLHSLQDTLKDARMYLNKTCELVRTKSSSRPLPLYLCCQSPHKFSQQRFDISSSLLFHNLQQRKPKNMNSVLLTQE